jgi:hypothetical protein
MAAPSNPGSARVAAGPGIEIGLQHAPSQLRLIKSADRSAAPVGGALGFPEPDLLTDQCIRFHRTPWRFVKSDYGNAMGTSNYENAIACGSKEFDPPFPFPQGESRGGMVPPTPLHVPRQPKPLARPLLRLPPQEGYAPLRDPPLGVSRWSAWSEADRTRKKIRMAATSSLTFMTFS